MRPKVKITGTSLLPDTLYRIMETLLTEAFFRGVTKANGFSDPLLLHGIRDSINSAIYFDYSPRKFPEAIYSFQVTCDMGNNTPGSLAQGYVFCNVTVVYQTGGMHAFELRTQ